MSLWHFCGFSYTRSACISQGLNKFLILFINMKLSRYGLFCCLLGRGESNHSNQGTDFFIFFLLSLFLTLYMFLHLTTMCSCTFRTGWLGRGCLHFTGMNTLVVLACESLDVCTACIWHCKHARLCVEVFLCTIYKFSFIHNRSNSWESYTEVNLRKAVADLSYCNSRQPGAASDSGDSVFVLPTPSGCSKTDGCQHSHLCLFSLVNHRKPRADLYP